MKPKVLFLSNKFETIDHGPAKFAQLLNKSINLKESIDLRIVTPDVTSNNASVYQLKKK